MPRAIQFIKTCLRNHLPEEIVEAIRFRRTVRNIRKSRLFDSSYYLSHNPEALHSGLKPIQHYLLDGAKKRYDPGPLFSTKTYLINFGQDIEIENPLLDFMSRNIDFCVGAYKSLDIFRGV